MGPIFLEGFKAKMQAYSYPAKCKRRARDDLYNYVKYNPKRLEGCIAAFRLAASTVEKIMDDEFFNHLIARIKAKVYLKVLLCIVK